MYIFKYHPDNTIYRNGDYVATFAKFKELNPNFPITEGQFFEYSNDKFVLINDAGHDVDANSADYTTLIEAINNLE
jgi:hypothetical protein